MAVTPVPGSALERINYLVKKYEAYSYLEIGVIAGQRFRAVCTPLKAGVVMPTGNAPADPEPGTYYFPMSSDDFFSAFREGKEGAARELRQALDPPVFDMILIDGMHTFAQSLRDFENSLACAHPDTLFILQGSVPCDPYSALPDQRESLAYRKQAGLPGLSWHGDVFKTVLAIHDLYPRYSYCTLVSGGSQTLLWQAGESERTTRFSSLEEIDALDYFGMLRNADLMMPIKNDLLPDIVGLTLAPGSYREDGAWKKLISGKKEVTP
ncbi:MAG: class I SAM-dependent methyltransferase [Deltaproteobacteria bacterium]|jgi:hypothetical protein|nr:class I SAM-dependent methyltransferase [Deltaproteobacteria bacterium]